LLILKRQRKFVAAIVAINILATSLISPLMVKAETNYTDVQNSVNLAVAEKNFYYYNMAFGRIMELPEGYERDVLLGQLATITNEVWTQQIADIVQSFHIIAKEKSGREYDKAQRLINNSSLKEIDKQYLLHELNTWGRDTVWTADYKKAIDAIIKVWTDKTEAAAQAAEKAISELKVELNKAYLTELFEEAKNAVGLGAIILDGKYFDSLVNKVYVGNGKSVNLDLSKDTTARTIILQGNIKTLNINAPKATVIVENANVTNLNIIDNAGTSLYLKGTTKLENLVVNDKNDASRIVLEGKATITSAEIKSGTKLEVKVDSEVLKPFGKLIINTAVKKALQFIGDFKDTIVRVEKPAQLTVENIIKRIEFGKDSANSLLNTTLNTKISEVNVDAVLTIDGPTGVVKTVSGLASGQVIYKNSAIPTGGGGGGIYIPSDTTAPVITLSGNAIVNVANGAAYTDAGATASDDRDGNITSRIVKTIKNAAGQIITSIDTTVAGTYTIEYTVSDSAGNAALKITRTVIVAAPQPQGPSISDLNSGKSLPQSNYAVNGAEASGTYGSSDAAQPTIVNGNLLINDVNADVNRSIILQNIKINGTLTVDYGSGTIKLINVTADNVVIKNVGKNSLVVSGDSEIKALRVEDENNDAHIVVEGNGTIIASTILSGAQIETSPDATNPNPMGEINLAPSLPQPISLSGSFKTVNVTKSAEITLAHGTEVTDKLNLEASSILTVPEGASLSRLEIGSDSNSETGNFVLNGAINNVDIKGNANIEVEAGIVAFSDEASKRANINVSDNAKIIVVKGSGDSNLITGDGTVIYRGLSSEANLIDVKLNGAKFDRITDTISSIARNTTVSDLIKGAKGSDFAKVDVVDSSGNPVADLSSTVTEGMKLRVTSEDLKQSHTFNLKLTPPPTMAANYPKCTPGALSSKVIKSEVKADQDGTLYVVVLAKGASAPNAEQIKAGKDAAGTYAINGRINVVRDQITNVGIQVPQDGTEYDLYFVLADIQGNLQAIPKVTAASPVKSSSANDIIKYRIKDKSYSFTFNDTAKYIEFHVPEGTDVTQLVPEITVSSDATINAVQGAAVDFSKTVNYVVTAQDGTPELWTVKCIIDKKVLNSIAVKTPPIKRVYRQVLDQNIDITGLVVEGKYSDGTTAVIAPSNVSVSGFDISRIEDNQVITVTAEGKTTTFTVMVTEKPEKPATPTPQALNFNDTANTIDLTTDMEYKLDEAAFTPYTAGALNPTVLKGRHTLRVRIAAKGIHPASDAVTIEFNPSETELKLQNAKNAAALIQKDYTPESWMAIDIAKALPESSDAEMDAKTAALNNAVANLVTISAEVEKSLQAAKTAANLTAADFTPTSWAILVAARDNMPEDSDIQKAAKTKAINGALTTLVRVADENLQREKARASEKSKIKSEFSAASWSVLSNALLMPERNDSEKNSKAQAISTAITGLKYLVDGSLQTAKDNAGALVEAVYTTESWAVLATAKNLPEASTAEKNNKITAINAAIAGLVTKSAALTAELKNVKANAAALTQANYKADSWKVLTDALALPETNDTEKTNKIQAINRATSSLVTEAAVLNTNLQTAKASAAALSQASYTQGSWSRLATALNAPEASNQEKLDKITAINSAIKALVTVIDADLQTARDSAALVQENYTAETWAELVKALALPERNNIDKPIKTAAINTAVRGLIKVSDASLQAAEQAIRALNPTDYTPVTWLEVEKARSLSADNDSLKLIKAQALRNAAAGLVTVVDDNLIKAKQRAALRIKDDYTTDSWASLQAALNMAAADNGQKIAKTQAINAAIDGLVLLDRIKPVISLNGSSVVAVDVGASYTEQKATVQDNSGENITVVIIGSVDTTKVGVYEVKYNAKDSSGNQAVEVVRKVYVQDKSAPIVTVIGGSEQRVKAGAAYNYDYTGWLQIADNYDRSPKVEIIGTIDIRTLGAQTLRYIAVDASGNRAQEVIRTVIVEDKTAPSIAELKVTIKNSNEIINITPANTQVIDLTSLITSNGLVDINTVEMLLNTSLKGENNTDTKLNVTAALDFTTSELSTRLQELLKALEDEGIKTSGTVQEIESMLQKVLKLAAGNYEQLIKVNGTKLTLKDAAGNESKYTILTNQALVEANKLVVEVEKSKLQADLNAARTAVNALADGSFKTALIQRLNVVEAEIIYNKKVEDAKAAVAKAEASKIQKDVDDAAALVNLLEKQEDKAPLQAKLAVVQEAINVKNATEAVVKAEQSKKQEDVTAARTLVNELASPEKAELTRRLDVVQQIINDQLTYQQKVKNATDAVVKAEGSKLQKDVDEARTAVNLLLDADKVALNNRLDEVQIQIDAAYAVQLAAATTAVQNAQASKNQADINSARTLVNGLKANDRTRLTAELDAIQDIVNARIQLEASIDAARELMDSKIVGTEPGNVPAGAKAEFNTAINLAANALSDLASTLPQIQAQITALHEASGKFNDSVIKADEFDSFVNAIMTLVGTYGKPYGISITGSAPSWSININNPELMNTPASELYTKVVDKIANGALSFDKVEILLGYLDKAAVNGGNAKEFIINKLHGKPHTAQAVEFLQSPSEAGYERLVTALKNNDTYAEIVAILKEMMPLQGNRQMPTLGFKGMNLEEIYIENSLEGRNGVIKAGQYYSVEDIKAMFGLDATTVEGSLTFADLMANSIGFKLTGTAGERTYWFNKADLEKTPELLPTQVVVKNNSGEDTVKVSGLTPGDTVRVYNLQGSILGSYQLPENIPTGTVIVEVSQLGTGAGSVFVTVQRKGKAESDSIEKKYNS
jgi:hypothetical protein